MGKHVNKIILEKLDKQINAETTGLVDKVDDLDERVTVLENPNTQGPEA